MFNIMKKVIVVLGVLVALVATMLMSSCESRSGKLSTVKDVVIPVTSITDEKDSFIYFSRRDTVNLSIYVRTYRAHKSKARFVGTDSLHVSSAVLIGGGCQYITITK